MLVGRESEEAALHAFLDSARDAPIALLMEGEQGIGKSTLLRRAVEEAHRREYRVLTCRPTGSDADLSFVALGDLLGSDAYPYVEALPDPQRDVLEIALLRTKLSGRTPEPRATAVATLSVLGAISTEMPTIVAIDDVQWIDPATTRVLSFAARRLTDERLGFLLSRPTSDEPPPLGLADAFVERLGVVNIGPLTDSEIATVVRDRTGQALSKPESRRLAELSGGNPFYALEIARAQARGVEGVTGQRLPIPKSLRDDLIRARVAAVATKTLDLLLLAASMARPTVDSLGSFFSGAALSTGLEQATDAGIIEVLGLDVRFVHPLYRSAIYADASRTRRHRTHARLAEAVSDPEERARHLALSADEPEERIAQTVEDGAALARDRGAPDAAAELLEHALRLTPPVELGSARRRQLRAARDSFSAGDADGARMFAREALRVPGVDSDRTEPLQILGAVELARGKLEEARVVLEDALTSAESDLAMTAEIHRDLARVTLRAGNLAAADRHARAALDAAGAIGDPEITAQAMICAADVDVLFARQSASMEKLAHHPPAFSEVGDSQQLVLASVEALSGRLDEAEHILDRLLVSALDRGDEPGRLTVMARLAEVELRRGSWEGAAAISRECGDLASQLGLNEAIACGLMAYSAAGLGLAEEARAFAEQGIGLASSDRPALLWNLAGLGFLELSLGRFAEARRYLTRAGGVRAEMGVLDPSVFPFLADEAEALVAVGELPTALGRISELEQAGKRLDRRSVVGQAARCRGLAVAAGGEVDEALSHLERAVAIHGDGGVPIDHGRSLLALGATRRRARQKRPAREALDLALSIFVSSSSRLWEARARDELERISGRRASAGELTESEERVARMAAAGMTNREIAQTLYLGVRTVEGHLSHAYAKLGVRSRTELSVFFQAPD